MTTYETGATSSAANNLVLSVLNDGSIYQKRLHCGFAALQGYQGQTDYSFRTLANNEAKLQRLMGSKFKPQEITEAAKLIQADTITHCLEIMRNEGGQIIVSGRKWSDNINGNSYFSCKVQIGKRWFAIPFQYGYGDQWQWEARKVLEKHGFIETSDKPKSELPIFWEFEGAVLKRYMFNGIYI